MLNSLYAPKVGIFLAFLSSIFWGVGGFCAGQASRRAALLPILTLDIFIGICVVTPLSFLVADSFTLKDFLIGGFAGLFGIGGAGFLYAGMQKATYVTVIPASGVVSALVPVVWGVFSGDNLSFLTLQTFTGSLNGLKEGILAGLGFGGFFVVIENTSKDTEPWASVGSRVFPLFILLFILRLTRNSQKPSKTAIPYVLGSGLANVTASTCFLFAVNRGMLSITSLLSALYPAITVLIAHFLISEKMTKSQIFGVGAAIFSMASIAIG